MTLLRESLADFFLVVRWLPVHVVDVFGLLAQHRFGIPVTVQAPLHQQSVRLKNERHLVHGSVAGAASNAFIHMNAVVEIGKIRKPVDFYPLDRFVVAIAIADGLKVTGVVEKHGVTIHAGFRWRDPGKSGSFHACVAVAAVNSIVSYVMFVAELHGLFASNVLAGQIRRTRRCQHRQNGKPHDEQKRKHTKSRDEVRASMKNLSHVRFALWRGAH